MCAPGQQYEEDDDEEDEEEGCPVCDGLDSAMASTATNKDTCTSLENLPPSSAVVGCVQSSSLPALVTLGW